MTYIPDENRLTCRPINNYNAVDSFQNEQPVMVMKFNGCTPSTVIGTLFMTVSISVEPTAGMRGILRVTPRGSYEGTFRAIRQARKKGIAL